VNAPGYTDRRGEVLTRLRRIEGQVRGLQRMVDDDRYCVDVLGQISSVTNALERVGLLLLNEHIRHCVRASLADGGGDDRVEELVVAVDRFMRAT